MSVCRVCWLQGGAVHPGALVLSRDGGRCAATLPGTWVWRRLRFPCWEPERVPFWDPDPVPNRAPDPAAPFWGRIRCPFLAPARDPKPGPETGTPMLWKSRAPASRKLEGGLPGNGCEGGGFAQGLMPKRVELSMGRSALPAPGNWTWALLRTCSGHELRAPQRGPALVAVLGTGPGPITGTRNGPRPGTGPRVRCPVAARAGTPVTSSRCSATHSGRPQRLAARESKPQTVSGPPPASVCPSPASGWPPLASGRPRE